MKDMRNIYVYKNLPHFCPRKNGDSCRPVSGFHRLKRDLHSRIVIPISPTGLLRPFPCSLRVSVSIVSVWIRMLFLSSGFSLMPFLSFSRARSLLLSRRFRSPLTPLSPVSSVSRSFPALPSLAVVRCGVAFRLSPSRLPSRYSMR